MEILGNGGFIDFDVLLQFAIHTRRSARYATHVVVTRCLGAPSPAEKLLVRAIIASDVVRAIPL